MDFFLLILNCSFVYTVRHTLNRELFTFRVVYICLHLHLDAINTLHISI